MWLDALLWRLLLLFGVALGPLGYQFVETWNLEDNHRVGVAMLLDTFAPLANVKGITNEALVASASQGTLLAV